MGCDGRASPHSHVRADHTGSTSIILNKAHWRSSRSVAADGGACQPEEGVSDRIWESERWGEVMAAVWESGGDVGGVAGVWESGGGVGDVAGGVGEWREVAADQ